MPHPRYVSRAILGAISLSQTRLPACLPASISCPPACPPVCLCVCLCVCQCVCLCICICLSHLSLLLFYYYIVIIRDFIVHAAFTLCLATRDPLLPGNRVAQSVPNPGFSICTPSVHPGLQSAATFVAGQIGPFLFTLSPRLVRHRVPVTGRASKHVTYPSSFFFFFLSLFPLPLSSSPLLWICWHIDKTRETSNSLLAFVYCG